MMFALLPSNSFHLTTSSMEVDVWKIFKYLQEIGGYFHLYYLVVDNMLYFVQFFVTISFVNLDHQLLMIYMNISPNNHNMLMDWSVLTWSQLVSDDPDVLFCYQLTCNRVLCDKRARIPYNNITNQSVHMSYIQRCPTNMGQKRH